MNIHKRANGFVCALTAYRVQICWFFARSVWLGGANVGLGRCDEVTRPAGKLWACVHEDSCLFFVFPSSLWTGMQRACRN